MSTNPVDLRHLPTSCLPLFANQKRTKSVSRYVVQGLIELRALHKSSKASLPFANALKKNLSALSRFNQKNIFKKKKKTKAYQGPENPKQPVTGAIRRLLRLSGHPAHGRPGRPRVSMVFWGVFLVFLGFLGSFWSVPSGFLGCS